MKRTLRKQHEESSAYKLGLAISRYESLLGSVPPEVCIELLQEIVAQANAEIARLREQMAGKAEE